MDQLLKYKKQKLDVYHASAGEYLAGPRYGYVARQNDTHDTPIDHTQVPKLTQDGYQQPLRVISGAEKMSWDELLSMSWGIDPAELPYMTRDQVRAQTNVDLPDSELLQCLHYYMADRISREDDADDLTGFLDETALIALGRLVQDWLVENQNGQDNQAGQGSSSDEIDQTG